VDVEAAQATEVMADGLAVVEAAAAVVSGRPLSLLIRYEERFQRQLLLDLILAPVA
jgi:hypothetical protein